MKRIVWVLAAMAVILTGCHGKERQRIQYAYLFQEVARDNFGFEVTVRATGKNSTVFEISGGLAATAYANCARRDSTYFDLERMRELGFKKIHIKASSNNRTLYARRL